jgi:hypothetical protein
MTMMTRPGVGRRWPAVGLVTVALAGCGGSAESEGERPVTDGEAARMAETLFENHDLGGAQFELSAQMPDGSRLDLTGEVDWLGHQGRAVVEADGGPEEAIDEVVWTATSVLERIPSLDELAQQVGRPMGGMWARSPDPDRRDLDAMIQLVTSLAATESDNAVLIAQEPGTAFLRTDTVPATDVAVDVLRYGERTVYWLARDGVTMWRFEGNDATATRPVVVDLRDHGERVIDLPADDEVVAAASVAELYRAVTGVDP